ncbi:MAG: hypothetical protein K0S11_1045, partial [Gammaproteobacteria bacterium]|nr:hypothetical protein [Gammaproteobacteria bacterium]
VKDTAHTGPWLIAILNNYILTGQVTISTKLAYKTLLETQQALLAKQAAPSMIFAM